MTEGQGEMPGTGLATTLMTLGYDPQKKRYVGTWVGSMMAHLWVYDGTLDVAERVLTLDTEGTSHAPGDDGKWHRFMTAHYRRKR